MLQRLGMGPKLKTLNLHHLYALGFGVYRKFFSIPSPYSPPDLFCHAREPYSEHSSRRLNIYHYCFLELLITTILLRIPKPHSNYSGPYIKAAILHLKSSGSSPQLARETRVATQRQDSHSLGFRV